jgi:uncharacterized protein YbbK (DUF523 family)
MILVSKCCIGVPCRYRHTGFQRKFVAEIGMRGDLLAVCPEQKFLPTPREPHRVIRGRFVGQKTGADHTPGMQAAVASILDLVRQNGIRQAYLLSNSPACGQGYGLLALALAKAGVEIIPV